MTNTPGTTGRKLRFLGDGEHGERTVSTQNQDYEVEISPLDLTNAYRQAYLVGVYSDPDANPDTTAMDAAGDAAACPCASVASVI